MKHGPSAAHVRPRRRTGAAEAIRHPARDADRRAVSGQIPGVAMMRAAEQLAFEPRRRAQRQRDAAVQQRAASEKRFVVPEGLQGDAAAEAQRLARRSRLRRNGRSRGEDEQKGDGA